MENLDKEKVYQVGDKIKEGLVDFYGGFATIDETNAAIGDMYKNNGYLMDTHTAVAYKVYQDYVEATGDSTPTIIASTASAYKFADSAAKSIGLSEEKDDFAYVAALHEKTDVRVPSGLNGLESKEIRHTGVLDINQMQVTVKECLK